MTSIPPMIQLSGGEWICSLDATAEQWEWNYTHKTEAAVKQAATIREIKKLIKGDPDEAAE